MQIKYTNLKAYYEVKDECEVAKKRKGTIISFLNLKKEGCTEKTALEALNVSRATIFRWLKRCKKFGISGLSPGSRRPGKTRQATWSKALEQSVYKLRKKYPVWGKRSLTTILNRDLNIKISVSMVGRILKKLADQGLILPVRFYTGDRPSKRSRNFNKYAKPWSSEMKATKPGELVQIDHMTIPDCDDRKLKHFKATCPVSKVSIFQVYTNATSESAADFLRYAQQEFPFLLKSVQVDGGSEFQGEFEEECEKLDIKLFVLPPRSPELNGCVERCNRTVRNEFYRLYNNSYQLNIIRAALKQYMYFHNHIRPHQSLTQETPMSFLNHNFRGLQKSHMY